jgi:hypothetical protein
MMMIKLIQDGNEQFWELRTRDFVVIGEVTPGGWLKIDRVVHTEASECQRQTVEAHDIPGGLAHLGCCS